MWAYKKFGYDINSHFGGVSWHSASPISSVIKLKRWPEAFSVSFLCSWGDIVVSVRCHPLEVS